MSAEKQTAVDEYWHFRWTAFVWACLVCLTLFGVLVLTRHVAPIDTAASVGDYLVLACGFFMSVVGVKGETWDAQADTWFRRLTWAGRLILLGLLFTLSVTLYQKLAIDAGRKAEQARLDNEAREERKTRVRQLEEALNEAVERTTADVRDKLTREIAARANESTALLENNRRESATTFGKIEKGLLGCPTDVQNRLRPDLVTLREGLATGGRTNAEILGKLTSMTERLDRLAGVELELVTVRDRLDTCLASHKLSDELLLRNWEGHWADGNWFTEGSFARTDDGRLSFNALTKFAAAARKGKAAQSAELMRWEGEPFSCDTQGEQLEFPIARNILPSAEVIDENLKPQVLRSTMRFRLGLALLGEYGGGSDKARLVLYAAR
jgi:hypothetical protein